MAKEEKRSFVLYYDYREHLQILTDEERGKLLMALMDYGMTGEPPKLKGAALMAFSFITSQMDRDAERYAEKCKKRSEAGKQGGRPRKAKATEDATGKPSKESEPKEKAKKANAFPQKQSKAKKADNDNGTDNDTDNDNGTDTDTTPLPPPEGENKTPSSPAEPVEADKTPYKVIVTLYHDRCKSYPKLRGLSDQRKKAIAARWKEYEHSLDTFRELFEKAEDSKFLKGESDSKRNWKADFNWLMNSENMAKVLEGKYDNPKEPKVGEFGSSFDADEFFQAALARSFRNMGIDETESPVTASEAKRIKNPPKTAAEDEEVLRKAEELKARLGS